MIQLTCDRQQLVEAVSNVQRAVSSKSSVPALEGILLKAEAEGEFTLLLSHHPELAPLYGQAGLDLVFTGHAHGGQIRLPLVGGLFAPGQGIFPRYTAGAYPLEGGGRMVVSRGLGNSRFPQRLFNRPQLVAVTLRRENRQGEESSLCRRHPGKGG